MNAFDGLQLLNLIVVTKDGYYDRTNSYLRIPSVLHLNAFTLTTSQTKPKLLV